MLEDLYYVSFLKTDGTFIKRLDLNGRLGLGYIRPDRVSRELIKKIPPFKNQISAIRISPDYAFVFRFAPDITDKNSLSSVDVFTRKGEFLGAAQLKEVPIFISKRAMYFARAHESGNVFLVRTEYSLLF